MRNSRDSGLQVMIKIIIIIKQSFMMQDKYDIITESTCSIETAHSDKAG